MGFFRTNVLPLFAGTVVAGLLIWATELLGLLLYPLPPGVNLEDPASYRAAMASLPSGALVLVLVGWILGTFAGSWMTARRSTRSPIRHGLAFGVLFLLSAVWNLLTLPHPTWFWALGLALFLPVSYLGARLGAASAPEGPAPAAA